MKTAARFWSKVDRSGGPDACWPWTAGMFSTGYGAFKVDGRTLKASRMAYELSHGPLGLLQALHHCDNPPCCNPRHLYAGTVQDNVRDRDARGRRPTGDQVPYENRARGSRHPDAALNETQVAQIRSELQRGCSYANLADRYGVSKGAIAFIARNRTWKHVPWPNGDRDD
jgi:hypothetical protein